jgi:glycerophosphoryl diester phosphodiesterase
VAVIAHRGAHEHAPENTIPAIQAAIDLGVDYVEIDVQTTKDGALVLMHNHTVERTTNGTGAIRDLAFAEIRALDAGAWFSPQFAGTRVPTADEALGIMRGKAAAYLDTKDIAPDSVVALLRRNEMLASVVYDGPANLAEMLRVESAIRTMPEYPRSPEALRALADSIRLDVVAISSLRNLSPEAVAACHAVNAQVFLDIMAQDNPEGWGRAIECGVDGIQTDRPAALLRYLRGRELH